MGKWTGGMEFQPGEPIRLPPVPAALPASPLEFFFCETPVVEPGQNVVLGQPLAEPASPDAAAVISSASGVIREISATEQGGYRLQLEPSEKEMPTSLPVGPPLGRRLGEWFESLMHVGPWPDMDGGVGLTAQLRAAQTQPPDTLICMGLDEYPPYADTSSLLMSFPDDAVLGTLILADLTGATDVSMLVSQSSELGDRLKPSCHNYRMNLKTVHNTYPSAHPTLTTWAHTPGRRPLPHGANPVKQGVMLISPWTAIRIGRWFTLRKFDIVRPMFIAQPEPTHPLFSTYALPGQQLTSLHPRLKAQDGHHPINLALGNPMTGRLLRSGDMSAGKPGSVIPLNQLLVSVLTAAHRPAAHHCISCGWCAEVCPTSLRPAYLLELARSRKHDALLREQLSFCIHCGLCSHVCPSELPLAQSFREVTEEFHLPVLQD